MNQKIRVENLANIAVSQYADSGDEGPLYITSQPFRILFIKPYQGTTRMAHGPAYGILTLVSVLREKFSNKVTPFFRDMKIYAEYPHELYSLLPEYRPDVVAVSALNVEAAASFEIARICKQCDPNIVTVLGGPLTLRQSVMVFQESQYDWVFEGAADRTFPQALVRHFNGKPLGVDIPGFSYRDINGDVIQNSKQDLITDLDAIPPPAWDLHDFEAHRRIDKSRMITNLAERRYAYLFTSRGCPYLCNYCHDIFTKRFIYQSTERVISEIEHLHEKYGVVEFHFIDDIFNLHRPRVKEIMGAISKRWGKSLYLAFPNGLRGDILDKDTIDSMVSAGTYNATISIETVTPRMQTLVEKYLDVGKAKWAIEEFDRQGVVVHGSFMFGFPTESVDEIKSTLAYAIKSPLSHVHFFAVVPQPETPIYSQAFKESPQATESVRRAESGAGDYNSDSSWYQLAYGYPLRRTLFFGMLAFYFYPKRMLKFIKIYKGLVVKGFLVIMKFVAQSIYRKLMRVVGRSDV